MHFFIKIVQSKVLRTLDSRIKKCYAFLNCTIKKTSGFLYSRIFNIFKRIALKYIKIVQLINLIEKYQYKK